MGLRVEVQGRARARVRAIVIVIVLLAGIGVVAVTFVDRGATMYSGSTKIANANAVLSSTKKSVDQLVRSRQGVEASDTRCYFARASTPPARSHHDEVGSDVWCGPVLFLADKPSADYLQFALRRLGPMFTDQVAMATATAPRSQTPISLPATKNQLMRPDGRAAKASERLRPPPVPPEAPDIFARTDFVGTTPPALNDVQMGSLTGGVALASLGTTPTYGAGDETRQPAPGQKFIAFRTGATESNTGGGYKELDTQATVQVDDDAPRPLPVGSGQYYLLEVPTSAMTVNLQLGDAGFNQSISLLTGKAATGNIAVLGRLYRSPSTPLPADPITYTYSPKVIFPDKTAGTSETGSVTVSYLGLQYEETVGTTTVVASSVTNAIMVIDVTSSYSHDPGGPFEVDPGLVSFTPTGGTAIPAKPLADDTHEESYVEVPANITAGTLDISGSIRQLYSDALDTYTVSVATPLAIPVTFRAG